MELCTGRPFNSISRGNKMQNSKYTNFSNFKKTNSNIKQDYQSLWEMASRQEEFLQSHNQLSGGSGSSSWMNEQDFGQSARSIFDMYDNIVKKSQLQSDPQMVPPPPPVISNMGQLNCTPLMGEDVINRNIGNMGMDSQTLGGHSMAGTVSFGCNHNPIVNMGQGIGPSFSDFTFGSMSSNNTLQLSMEMLNSGNSNMQLAGGLMGVNNMSVPPWLPSNNRPTSPQPLFRDAPWLNQKSDNRISDLRVELNRSRNRSPKKKTNSIFTERRSPTRRPPTRLPSKRQSNRARRARKGFKTSPACSQGVRERSRVYLSISKGVHSPPSKASAKSLSFKDGVQSDKTVQPPLPLISSFFPGKRKRKRIMHEEMTVDDKAVLMIETTEFETSKVDGEVKELEEMKGNDKIDKDANLKKPKLKEVEEAITEPEPIELEHAVEYTNLIIKRGKPFLDDGEEDNYGIKVDEKNEDEISYKTDKVDEYEEDTMKVQENVDIVQQKYVDKVFHSENIESKTPSLDDILEDRLIWDSDDEDVKSSRDWRDEKKTFISNDKKKQVQNTRPKSPVQNIPVNPELSSINIEAEEKLNVNASTKVAEVVFHPDISSMTSQVCSILQSEISKIVLNNGLSYMLPPSMDFLNWPKKNHDPLRVYIVLSEMQPIKLLEFNNLSNQLLLKLREFPLYPAGPQFTTLRLKKGAINTICANKESLNWLQEIIKQVHVDGIPLSIVDSAEQESKKIAVQLTIPGPLKHAKVDEIFSRLCEQNAFLYPASWIFLGRRELIDKQCIAVAVGEMSARTIVEQKMSLFLGFRKISALILGYLEDSSFLKFFTSLKEKPRTEYTSVRCEKSPKNVTQG